MREVVRKSGINRERVGGMNGERRVKDKGENGERKEVDIEDKKEYERGKKVARHIIPSTEENIW